jgi:hypothetical protein
MDLRGEMMPVVHPSLFFIMQRFPECKNTLRYMYSRSVSFKTLCNDYQRSSEALRHWRISEHEQAPKRCQEYLEILQEIEEEIRQRLKVLR